MWKLVQVLWRAKTETEKAGPSHQENIQQGMNPNRSNSIWGTNKKEFKTGSQLRRERCEVAISWQDWKVVDLEVDPAQINCGLGTDYDP